MVISLTGDHHFPALRVTMVRTLRRAVLLISILFWSLPLYPWGFSAHQQITESALSQTPETLQSILNTVSDSVISRSVEPDLIRDDHPEEYPNHFIDIDYYGKYPYPELPREYSAAVTKFSEDTVRKYGTLPWRIKECTDSLSVAMRTGERDGIVKWSAYLAHYIADAHQPLHAALNYDGQLTGNTGIHSRYETGMVDLYMKKYTYTPREVTPPDDPLSGAFNIVLESSQLAEAVIRSDDFATRGMSDSAIRALREHWDTERDSIYFRRLYHALGELTWERFDLAAGRLADYWELAWIRADRPDLQLK